MTCKRCGQHIKSNERFCTSCGATVEPRKRNRGQRELSRDPEKRKPHREDNTPPGENRTPVNISMGDDETPEDFKILKDFEISGEETIDHRFPFSFGLNHGIAFFASIIILYCVYQLFTADYSVPAGKIARNTEYNDTSIILAVILPVIGFFMFLHGLKLFRRRNTMQNTPTTPVNKIRPGFVELNGKAEGCNRLLISPHGNFECVYYEYSVEERYESPTDDNDYNWRTIDSGRSSEVFGIRDKTGAALIHPAYAEIHITKSNWSRRSGDRRYSEKCIREGRSLFVSGTAAPYENYFMISARDWDPDFRISDMSEEEHLSNLSCLVPLFILGGLAVIAYAIYVFLGK